jgi:rhodanese-related sulfurtransferase
MKEIKFSCPACGQHIQVAEEWSGRQIDCPACKKPVCIPPPRKAPESAPSEPVKPDAKPRLPGETVAAPPAETTRAAASAAPSAPPPGPVFNKPVQEQKDEAGAAMKKPEPPAAPKQAERLRVAVLTPEVKLDMVRAVRARIANESSWLPGLSDGANAYAAKVEGGKTVLVDVRSPEATRFSLIGAFLLEFHRRDVTPTAAGRRRLLDQEIVDAIRDVLIEKLSDEEREEAPDPLASRNPMSISHAECLAVLDVLEELYSQRMEQSRAEKARRRLGTTRLPDLVRKLEKKAQIAPEDVATALFHELMEVRRRLERLESRINQNK